MTPGGFEGGARVQALMQRPDGHVRVRDEVAAQVGLLPVFPSPGTPLGPSR